MPTELKGSCHCGAVRFTVMSHTPVPYQLCCCGICRKLSGYSGCVQLGADYNTLNIMQGKDDIKVYNAVCDRDTDEEKRYRSERSFCGKCSTMLWLWDKSWPDLCHPFAAAIDSDLKEPEKMTVLLTENLPKYVRLPEGKKDMFEKYPKESIEEWHKKHGEYVE